MERNTELLRLEEIVDQLLTKYSQLKSDYQVLEETLQERDDECAELKRKLENVNNEQTEVSTRVTGLLDRIAQWETQQEENEREEGSYPNEDDSGQGALFQHGNEEN